MLRNCVLYILVLCSGFSAVHAAPLRRVLRQDAAGFEVEVTFPEPRFQSVSVEGTAFSRVSLPGVYDGGNTGEPQLPSYGLPFSLPQGTRAEFSVQVLERRVILQNPPLPVPETSFGEKAAAAAAYRPNISLYAGSGWFPQVQTFLTPVDEWRFYQVQSVVFYPLRSDLSTGSYEWIEKVRIRVDYVRTEKASPAGLAPPQGKAAKSVAKHLLLNFDTADQNRTRPESRSPVAPEASAPGAGVRLQIGSSGLVRLPFDDLAGAGLEDGLRIAEVRVEERSFKNTEISTNPYVVTSIPRLIEDSDHDGVFGSGDYLVFYAENYEDRFQPNVRSGRYSRFHVYWVTGSGTGKSFIDVPSLTDPPDITVTAFKSTVRAEKDLVYTHIPNEEGTSFYPSHTSLFWRGPSENPITSTLRTPSPDANGEVVFTGYWRGNFLAGDFQAHSESIIFNGQAILDRNRFFGIHDLEWVSEPFSNVSLLRDGDNTFQAAGERLTSGGYRFGSGAYFDYIDATYDRLLMADNDALWFNSQGYSGIAEFTVSGFSSPDIMVLDVTVPQNPIRIGATVQEVGGSYSTTIVKNVSGSPHEYFAVVPGSFFGLPETPYSLSPDMEHLGVLGWGEGLDLSEAGRNSDYIIVTHPIFRDAMDRLAEHRRTQGLKAFVCEAQDLYDQFAGGHKTPEAIKSFLRLAYQTWENPPMYLVLGGDGNEDYRAETVFATPDWIPTLIITTDVQGQLGVREIAGTDPWYGQGLGEGEGIGTVAPDMFVGRLPVNDADQADRLVTKIINYESVGEDAEWRNRGVFQADDQYSQGITVNSNYCYWSVEKTFNITTQEVLDRIVSDGGYDSFHAVPFFQSDYLDTAAELGRTSSPGNCPNLIATRFYVDEHLSPVLLDTLNQGGVVWAFTGHANASLMATEAIMHVQEEVLMMNNLGRPYVFMGFACHLAEFERALEKKGRSFGEVLLDLENRGAVAVLASTSFEWLNTNGASQLATTAPLFWDVFRDPDTGKQRRIIGEAFFAGLYALWLNTPISNYFNLSRTYTLLGDPAMRMDILPPEMQVELNGVRFQNGARLKAEAFGDTLRIRAVISEDVDLASVRVFRGGAPADSSDYTLTEISATPSGRRTFELLYNTTLGLGNSDIVLETTDWSGAVSRFNLLASVDLEFRVDGNVVVPGGENLIEPSSILEALVEMPAPLGEKAFSATVDGIDHALEASPLDQDGRSWKLTLSQLWAHGPNDVVFQIQAGEELLSRAIQLSVPSVKLALEKGSVAFYPNPLEGSEGTLTYRLTNSAEHVELQIYSVRGRRVVSESLQGRPGWNYFTWKATDSLGDPIANGVYLAVLQVGDTIRHLERIVVSR